MLMVIKFNLSIVLCFCTIIGFSQVKTDSVSKQQSTVSKRIDSIVDGSLLPQKTIPAEPDTLNIKSLKDLPEAAELDQKWLEELYSNSLFDTIYKSVTELTYEPVDYPELTTDTLKARLERLNARTPFSSSIG